MFYEENKKQAYRHETYIRQRCIAFRILLARKQKQLVFVKICCYDASLLIESLSNVY